MEGDINGEECRHSMRSENRIAILMFHFNGVATQYNQCDIVHTIIIYHIVFLISDLVFLHTHLFNVHSKPHSHHYTLYRYK